MNYPSCRVGLYFHSLAGAGGAERMLLALCGALTGRGHLPEIITLDDPGAVPFRAPSEGVPWHRLGLDTGPAGKLGRAWRLRTLLRSRRIDLLVGFVMGADKTVYAGAVSAGVPILAAERNDPVIYRERLSPLARAPYWLLFRLCRRIAVQLPEYVEGYPAFLRGRIAVIPNPVEHAALVKRAPRVEEGVVLAVGRLHRQKGFDILLDAFARLAPRRPGWRLRVVGDGPERVSLEERAVRAGLGSRVEFTGALREVGDSFRQADLFAFPSRYEGFPNALAEAMAHGLPAVALASCRGAVSLLRGEECGLLSGPGESAAAFAERLDTLIADPPMRSRLGAAARDAVASFAAEPIFDRWETLIAESASRRR